MTIRGECEFCGNQVTGNQKAAFRVRGWEVERSGGGANRIAGKERQADRIVHADCLERYLAHGHQLGLAEA